MKVLQSRSFARSIRKFRKQEKIILDQQVHAIVNDPSIGQEKRGELKGVFVYKFKIHTTQYLLSYRLRDSETLELIMIGPHENYYRDLEKYLRGMK